MTTKDILMLNRGSESSGRGSPTAISSPVTLDVTLGHLKSISHKDDMTVMSHHEKVFHFLSEIFPTLKTATSSHTQGPVASITSDKSNFYLDKLTAMPSTAFSAAVSTSSSDGQSRTETVSTIFSFGTELMAAYKKWEDTKPVPAQSSAFDSENTSTGFERAKSNLQADGPSYEHPKLESGQEHNVHRLNSTDPTVDSDLFSLYPTAGEYPSLAYVKGASDYKEQSTDLSAADVKSCVNTAAPPDWGSATFLPPSHMTTDTATSLQGTLFLCLDLCKTYPTLAGDRSIARSANDFISNTDDSKLKGIISRELMPSYKPCHRHHLLKLHGYHSVTLKILRCCLTYM